MDDQLENRISFARNSRIFQIYFFVLFAQQTIGTLEEIQMPQNGILHEGVAALAEALKSNPNLKVGCLLFLLF